MIINQEGVINRALANHRQLAKRLLPHIKPEYFDSLEDRHVFEALKSFTEKYGSLPSKEALSLSIQDRRDLPDDALKTTLKRLDEIWELTPNNNIEWLTETIETFCKDKALRLAILESSRIYSGAIDKPKTAISSIITDALAVNFDNSIGMDIENYTDRFDTYKVTEERIEFDIDILNRITRGGVIKKKLHVFLAGTNIGKSLIMCSLAAHHFRIGKNVLYISGELSEAQVMQRIEGNLMDMDNNEIPNMDKNVYVTNMRSVYANSPGRLIVKDYPMSTVTVFQFYHLLDELKTKMSFVPDVIYVDYLGVFLSTRSSSRHGLYEAGKFVSEDLHALAKSRNVAIFTAAQINRSGWSSTDPDLDDVAESFGVTFAADLILMISQDEELLKDQKYSCIVRKNRYNSRSGINRFLIGVDYERMKVFEIQNQPEVIVKKKDSNDKSKNLSGSPIRKGIKKWM